jgi:hypothetical protein
MGAAENVALAGWLREQTTVLLRWARERLAMGHYTNVSPGQANSARALSSGSGRCDESSIDSPSDDDENENMPMVTPSLHDSLGESSFTDPFSTG